MPAARRLEIGNRRHRALPRDVGHDPLELARRRTSTPGRPLPRDRTPCHAFAPLPRDRTPATRRTATRSHRRPTHAAHRHGACAAPRPRNAHHAPPPLPQTSRLHPACRSPAAATATPLCLRRPCPLLSHCSLTPPPALSCPSHHHLPSTRPPPTLLPVPGPDPVRAPLWCLGGVRARHRPQAPCSPAVSTDGPSTAWSIPRSRPAALRLSISTASGRSARWAQQCSLRYVSWASVWLVWVQDPIDPAESADGSWRDGSSSGSCESAAPAQARRGRGLAAPGAGAGRPSCGAAICRAQSPGERVVAWTLDWGWLVEFDFETAECARGAVRDDRLAMLLGDLRLLGMSPTVALVDSAAELMP